jgi:hypothetical protein
VFDYDGLAQTRTTLGDAERLPPFSVLVTLSKHNGQLEPCLEALRQQVYPHFELIVVGEGQVGVDKQLQYLVDKYQARLIPGQPTLTQAASAAHYDYLALTGTAAVVDRGWLLGLARAFDHNPDVWACCGPHLPLELETVGQLKANEILSHSKDLYRFWCYNQVFNYAPELFGSWLNAAFRKDFLIDQLNQTGVKSHSQLLLPLFYKALELGKIVAYEPRAFVRERYERDEQKAIQWAQVEREAQRGLLLEALPSHPHERGHIQQWLNKDKPGQNRVSRLARYRRLWHNLRREIANVRSN